MKHLALAALFATVCSTAIYCTPAILSADLTGESPQDLGDRLKKDQNELVGPWVYDDVETGFSEARKTGKPVMIVFR